MADFNISIDNKYTTDTYENTKLTYQWIYNAMTEARIVNVKIKEEFMFDIGKLSCNCNSMQEFTDYAYGQDSFTLIEMKVYQINPWTGKYLFISVDDEDVRISTNNKTDLEKIVGILKREKISEEKHIDNYYSISANNININHGNNNTINTTYQNCGESKLKQWFVAIIQNLLANWIWYVLGVLISGGGIYYLLNLIR